MPHLLRSVSDRIHTDGHGHVDFGTEGNSGRRSYEFAEGLELDFTFPGNLEIRAVASLGEAYPRLSVS